jgi:enoyl reductase-like protein
MPPANPLAELEPCAVQLEKWTNKRNRLIRKARAEGHSLRTIAAAAGITHTAVANILNREP